MNKKVVHGEIGVTLLKQFNKLNYKIRIIRLEAVIVNFTIKILITIKLKNIRTASLNILNTINSQLGLIENVQK
jgi:hypothetical protein